MKGIVKIFRNPILISSILSTIFLILSSVNVIQITDSKINIIVNSIMSILSILGVLKVPHKKTDSTDKKNKTKKIIT